MPATARPPSALLAVVLAGVVPGAGHLYLGRPWRGILWVLACSAAMAAWILAAARSLKLAWLAGLPTPFLLLGMLVDTGMLARRARHAPRARNAWNHWWGYAILAAFSGFVVPEALASLMSRSVGLIQDADGHMAPTVGEADLVVFDPRAWKAREPQRGEVAVISGLGGLPVMRRIVGLPGERVEVRAGVAIVNGLERVEDYRLVTRSRDLFVAPSTLGPAEYLVLGDARPAAEAPRCRAQRGDLRGLVTYLLFPADLNGDTVGRPIR